MKKTILLLICTATLGLVSCKKDTIIQETPNRTYVYTIQPNAWIRSSDGETLSAELAVKEIDNITLDDEGVLVYMSHPNSSSSYIQVPYTFLSHAYSYELYNGGVAIDIQSSDVQATRPEPPTRAVTVKIVVIPSVFVP